ncbi:enoyl-CoA hydratase/isomerase family protein [Saccharopolyspora sp. ASAGF58]|uniref:enoyl-CoA hydratase/isomerase family protein n=1 Tax=Saccharopolyspora sp. ASAGF58 TaxID=2719023 RepID=UPI00144001C6|nr:enoyl-CoA hydratase-related protein [Saccharopolyspora sp. ASAGF58]QIZ37739.1 enoyl-CoA hydratase/isomerase family protein [Saccharopolyspora sp. ASAGF58]
MPERNETANDTSSEMRLEREGPIAWLTFDRPDRLNALSMRMLDELAAHLATLESSDARVVVLRGAGRAFSAGYDVSGDSEEIGDAHTRSSVADRDRQAAYIDRFIRIWRHPQPVIAAVHGYCMAGATQLALFCDITVVAEDTQIAASPAIPLGGGFISPLWSFQVGPQRAKEMSFVPGRRIDGRTAVGWGFANAAVPAGELEKYVRELALSIAKTPASILRMKKLAVNRVQEMSGFLTVAGMGADTDALIHTTPDVTELQELVKEIGLKQAIARFRS